MFAVLAEYHVYCNFCNILLADLFPHQHHHFMPIFNTITHLSNLMEIRNTQVRKNAYIVNAAHLYFNSKCFARTEILQT